MKIFITILLVLANALSISAQKHLPEIRYDCAPAVLSGHIVGVDRPDSLHLQSLRRYCSGLPFDALWRTSVALDENGKFEVSIPVGLTSQCTLSFGNHRFSCFVVPGKTVSFILNLRKLEKRGLAAALRFEGELARFNRDNVYAKEKGIDPESIYLEMERKRNMETLKDELTEQSEMGYFDYLDSTFEWVNIALDADKYIGSAYREYAKAVNRYQYGSMLPFCDQSIQYVGIENDEEYKSCEKRMNSRLENYMRDDPWANPLLSYVMWGMPDEFVESYVSRPVKLPDSYWKCYTASRYMQQSKKIAWIYSL